MLRIRIHYEVIEDFLQKGHFMGLLWALILVMKRSTIANWKEEKQNIRTLLQMKWRKKRNFEPYLTTKLYLDVRLSFGQPSFSKNSGTWHILSSFKFESVPDIKLSLWNVLLSFWKVKFTKIVRKYQWLVVLLEGLIRYNI